MTARRREDTALFALVTGRLAVTGVLVAVAVVLILLPVPGAARGTDPMTTTPAPPAAPPAGIPLAEVATRAAQLPDVLRTLTDPLAPSVELETIRRSLSELRRRFDLELATLGALLKSQPTLAMIQAQQQLWQRRQLEASRWLSMLTLRATHLQEALGRLAEIETTWRRTLHAAAEAGAAHSLLAQIDEALAAIDAARLSLEAQRTAVLDLQGVVAQEVTRLGSAVARLLQAQQRAVAGILTRDSPPLWDPQAWTAARDTLGGHFRDVAAARWNDLVLYLGDLEEERYAVRPPAPHRDRRERGLCQPAREGRGGAAGGRAGASPRAERSGTPGPVHRLRRQCHRLRAARLAEPVRALGHDPQ
jgi:hypothetical protein